MTQFSVVFWSYREKSLSPFQKHCRMLWMGLICLRILSTSIWCHGLSYKVFSCCFIYQTYTSVCDRLGALGWIPLAWVGWKVHVKVTNPTTGQRIRVTNDRAQVYLQVTGGALWGSSCSADCFYQDPARTITSLWNQEYTNDSTFHSHSFKLKGLTPENAKQSLDLPLNSRPDEHSEVYNYSKMGIPIVLQ